MKRILMYLSALLVMVLIFAGIGTFLIAKYINPNDFKPIISAQLKKIIKREVSITGNLSWRFFPEIGVKIGRLNIANPTTETPNGKIVIEEASVSVRLLPLFHRQIDISGIHVSGIDMPQFHVQHAVLNASDVKLGATFPVSLTFDYQTGKAIIPVKVNAQVAYNAAQKQINTNKLVATIAGALHITGDVNVDKIDTQPEMHAKFNLDADDLKPLLSKLSQDPQSVQAADHLKGNIELVATQGHINMDGQMLLGNLVANKLHFTDVTARPRFRNLVVSLSPVTATFYQGELKSVVNVDVSAAQPVITANTSISQVHTEGLMRDLLGSKATISIKSTANMNLSVKTSGVSADNLMRNMNGTGQFNFGPGILTGIDLKAVITSAYALIKKQPAQQSNDSNQSRFDSATGSISIHNGIIQSDNLLLNSPDFDTKGDGKIDLPGSWINCVFNTKVKKAVTGNRDDWTNLYGIAIPIAVRGNLTDPKVSLDAGQLLKAVASSQLNNTGNDARQKLQDKLLENVSPEAGQLIKGLLQ